MKDFATNILLTTDFSEASEEAVAKAGALARSSGAALHVLHVHGRPPAAPEAYVPAEAVVVSEGLDTEAAAALEELKTSKLAGVELVSLVTIENASAPLAICDYADEIGADLIVIGTHGRTGMRRLLIGSVSEKVVRHANCSVLVVPHGKG